MSPRPKAKTLNFEEATARLEEIVAQVNNPETGLEDMITLAAEASKQARQVRQNIAFPQLPREMGCS